MEETYMQYLIKSFKKTLSDNLYDLVIVDCNNNSLRTLNEFYCYAKDSNFVVSNWVIHSLARSISFTLMHTAYLLFAVSLVFMLPPTAVHNWSTMRCGDLRQSQHSSAQRAGNTRRLVQLVHHTVALHQTGCVVATGEHCRNGRCREHGNGNYALMPTSGQGCARLYLPLSQRSLASRLYLRRRPAVTVCVVCVCILRVLCTGWHCTSWRYIRLFIIYIYIYLH